MASKRRQRRHRCSRKQKLSKDEAFKIATAMRQRQPPGEPPYDAYPCDNCGQWHVGKRPWKVQQTISERRKQRRNSN